MRENTRIWGFHILVVFNENRNMTGNGGDDGDKMTNLTSGLSIQSVIPFSMAKNCKLPI